MGPIYRATSYSSVCHEHCQRKQTRYENDILRRESVAGLFICMPADDLKSEGKSNEPLRVPWKQFNAAWTTLAVAIYCQESGHKKAENKL